MRIGIVQVDGKYYNGVLFPNIAIMKIVGYHERLGDKVEWYNGNLYESMYDKIYASKIFSFSKLPDLPAGKTIIGGTGIDFYNHLPQEIEDSTVSYSLYRECNFHVGFSMKGCRFALTCLP